MTLPPTLRRIGVAIALAGVAAVLLAAHAYTSPRYSFHTINGGPLVVRFNTRTGNAEVCQVAHDDAEEHGQSRPRPEWKPRTPADSARQYDEWRVRPVAPAEPPHIDCVAGNDRLRTVERLSQ